MKEFGDNFYFDGTNSSFRTTNYFDFYGKYEYRRSSQITSQAYYKGKFLFTSNYNDQNTNPLVAASPTAFKSNTISLEQLLMESNGKFALNGIQKRIGIFNEIAVNLIISELVEDIQKLLGDCNLYLESLNERLVAKNIHQLNISWDNLYYLVEQYTLSETYDMIYFKITKENKKKDFEISEIISKCNKLSKSLGLYPIPAATLEINKIVLYRTPQDKIMCILNVLEIIKYAIGNSFSGDILLSAMIECLSRSNLDFIFTNLDYIKLFSFEKSVSSGKEGYALSTFEAAVSFIFDNPKLMIEHSQFYHDYLNTIQQDNEEQMGLFLQKPLPSFITSITEIIDIDNNDTVSLCLALGRKNSANKCNLY
jgi:hypothetical protein